MRGISKEKQNIDAFANNSIAYDISLPMIWVVIRIPGLKSATYFRSLVADKIVGVDWVTQHWKSARVEAPVIDHSSHLSMNCQRSAKTKLEVKPLKAWESCRRLVALSVADIIQPEEWFRRVTHASHVSGLWQTSATLLIAFTVLE